MRNFFLPFLLLALLICGSVDASSRYATLPPALDGSMMTYNFDECTLPELPDSLTPVYAAYVARHGARYLSSPNKLKPVLETLMNADSTGTLTPDGEALLKLMKEVERANIGNWGDLSPIGIEEERKLGTRMFKILPRLSNHGVALNCISSFVPRAVMTMYQFSNQLIRLNDKMTVATDEGPEFSPLLYMFAYNRAYDEYRKHGKWKHIYHKYVKVNVPTTPAERLFTHSNLSDKKLRELTLDIYEVLKANRAASLPAPTTQWMTEEEYAACWRASNLQHYLRNSITPLSDAPAIATIPLLKRIIDDTDKALANPGDSVALNGYFGHAETLLPLLSLIKVPECNDTAIDIENLSRQWKVEEIVPLGANLLILISRSNSGRHYASMQLNGQTVKPVRGHGEIVSWGDLRGFWEGIINEVMLKSRDR